VAPCQQTKCLAFFIPWFFNRLLSVNPFEQPLLVAVGDAVEIMVFELDVPFAAGPVLLLLPPVSGEFPRADFLLQRAVNPARENSFGTEVTRVGITAGAEV